MKDSNNNSVLFSTVAFAEMQEIVDDLANYKLSTYGIKALVRRLKECVAEHEKEIFKMVKVIDDYATKYKELYDKYSMPQKLNEEFVDIAKKLNFPISNEANEMGARSSTANPNIEMPFEDPVPEKDVEFMQKRLKDDDLSDVTVPKEEELSKDEVAAYQDVDKTLYSKFKVEKVPQFKDDIEDKEELLVKKTVKKRRRSKKTK